MIPLNRQLIESLLDQDDIVVDATCGNGNDTLFLAGLVPKGKVIAFDIQEQAIKNTEALLQKENRLALVDIHHASHYPFPESILPKSVKLFVYNLGYLPGGDKSLTTQTATSLQSIQQALTLLKPKGAISMMLYPGHEEGKKEAINLCSFAKALPKERYTVFHMQLLNRNAAPELLWIQETARQNDNSG